MLLLLCIAGAGCGRHTDSLDLVIVPGRGIPSVIELGMTPSEVRRRCRDLTAKDYHLGWVVGVPSLGASWEQKHPDDVLTAVYFVVTEGGVDPESKPSRRFCGTVAGGLSFAKDGGVTKRDIIGVFGVPRQSLEATNLAGAAADTLRRWGEDGESYDLLNPVTACELLNYPSQGILFDVVSNTVVRVAIYNAFRTSHSARRD